MRMLNRVKGLAESEGYTLLSTTYINQMEDLEFLCPEGHEVIRRWQTITRLGLRCSKCEEWTSIRIQKHLNEYYQGYKILSEYPSDNYRETFECPKGHIFQITWFNFLLQKTHCKECVKESKLSRLMKEIEDAGYKFIKLELEGKFESDDRVFLQCDVGHEKYAVRIRNFRSGARCHDCKNIKIGKRHRHTFEFVKNYVEIDSESNYKLLSTSYRDTEHPLCFQCDKGHEYTTTFRIFYHANSRCPHCLYQGVSPLNKYLRSTLKKWREQSLFNHGYICDITGSSENIEVHHKFAFHKIVKEVLIKLNLDVREDITKYSLEEMESIKSEINIYHNENLGVPLSSEVHSYYHSLFGYDSTIEQYEFFKENYEDLKNGTLPPQDFCVKTS